MITVWPFSNLTKQDLAKQENVLLLLCSEAAKSRLVKVETSHTVILPKHQAAWRRGGGQSDQIME